MTRAELKRLTLELSADVRAGRYEPDMDLGKAEHQGALEGMTAAYEARARTILAAWRARGLITDEELASRRTLGPDPEVLADRLQSLAESLPD